MILPIRFLGGGGTRDDLGSLGLGKLTRPIREWLRIYLGDHHKRPSWLEAKGSFVIVPALALDPLTDRLIREQGLYISLIVITDSQCSKKGQKKLCTVQF